jgi:hypothetical protein
MHQPARPNRVASLWLVLCLIAGTLLVGRPAAGANTQRVPGAPAAASAPTVAADDSYSLAEDSVLSVPAAGVLGNDTGDGALAASLSAAPSHGTLELNADGSFVYTPTLNYSGTDSFQYGASTGSPGALEYWAFDDGANPTAGANGHAGTLLNGPAFTTTIPLSLTSGTALAFDGSNDGVSVANSNLANQSFSVAFWAKRNTAGTYDIAVGQGTGSNNTVLHVGFRSSNVFTCAFWNNDLDTPSTYTDSNWHHWACTYDAITNQRAIYRDGGLVVAATASADYQGSGTFWIGNRNNGDHFGGLLDDVRLYGSALSQPQVQAAMAGGTPFLQDNATVSLTVSGIEDAPVAQADSYTTDQGIPLSQPAKSGTVSTIFAGGINLDGNMFNVTAGLQDIILTSFDLHINGTGMKQIAIYYKAGTYAGFEQTPAAWTLLGTTTVSSLGAGQATPVNLGGLTIPAGATYGLYVTGIGATLNYTFGANTYSDGALTITSGTGNIYPFADVFSPRTWNGTIHYEINTGVLLNDSDPEGAELSAALATPPGHGDLSLASDGSFTYTPTLSFSGQDSFSYIASDGVLTDTALVTLNVTPLPCLVEASGDDQTDYASADASALQAAVSAASPGDLIKVAGTCAGVQLTDGLSQTLAITQSVSIQGGYTTDWLAAPDPAGAPATLDAAAGGRVIHISGPITVTLSGLELINGQASNGAGLLSQDGASVSITRSSLAHNSASEFGGAITNFQAELSVDQSSFFDNHTGNGTIYNSGAASATITASSFYTNTATRGGALFNAANGSVVIANTTMAYNQASEGGGIHNRGVITATHNTFAYNSASFGSAIQTWEGSMALFNNLMSNNSGATADCLNQGTLTASSGNLIEDGTCDAAVSGDAALKNLGDYGGDTLSVALLPTSPAIDQAAPAACLAADQRGAGRPQGAACDIGAYEAGQDILTVARAGAGTGSVTSAPAGITCGATCTASFPTGATATLTATAQAGSTFAGWSGACSGAATCVVTIDQATQVTATFDLVTQYPIGISFAGTGTGTVSIAPVGISCTPQTPGCNVFVAAGTVVTLTATPAAGSTFAGWSGACSGAAACVVTVDQVRQVTATFTAAAPRWNLYLPLIRRP